MTNTSILNPSKTNSSFPWLNIDLTFSGSDILRGFYSHSGELHFNDLVLGNLGCHLYKDFLSEYGHSPADEQVLAKLYKKFKTWLRKFDPEFSVFGVHCEENNELHSPLDIYGEELSTVEEFFSTHDSSIILEYGIFVADATTEKIKYKSFSVDKKKLQKLQLFKLVERLFWCRVTYGTKDKTEESSLLASIILAYQSLYGIAKMIRIAASQKANDIKNEPNKELRKEIIKIYIESHKDKTKRIAAELILTQLIMEAKSARKTSIGKYKITGDDDCVETNRLRSFIETVLYEKVS